MLTYPGRCGDSPAAGATACSGGGTRPREAIDVGNRRLVMLCYGVLKNRTAFDAEWASGVVP